MSIVHPTAATEVNAASPGLGGYGFVLALLAVVVVLIAASIALPPILMSEPINFDHQYAGP
jgi:hypothetical protein